VLCVGMNYRDHCAEQVNKGDITTVQNMLYMVNSVVFKQIFFV
jgi:hypothetical protein